MPLVKVAQLSQLPPDSVTEVAVNGGTYALCRVNGRVTAMDGVCPHRGGPLGQGQLHNGRVMCPWHAWEWDCQTGANDFDPTKKAATFEVHVEGDDVLLAVP